MCYPVCGMMHIKEPINNHSIRYYVNWVCCPSTTLVNNGIILTLHIHKWGSVSTKIQGAKFNVALVQDG